MKAILCSQYCGPDDLVLADVPDPVAEAGQAVIAIKSAALNFFDLLMIQGKYQIKPPLPFSPAAEVAGVIESVGAGVTDLKVGDRVVASCGHNGAREKIEPPASSSSTALRCTRWKIAPASSLARPWRCLARPAAPAWRHVNSAS
jgi:NADPH2:quinone reductase